MTDFEPQLELKPLPKIPLPQGWSENSPSKMPDSVDLGIFFVSVILRFAVVFKLNWW